MFLGSFSFTFCSSALFRWRSRRPRRSRVRAKCYLLTSPVCVSKPSLQDNRRAEQASINNRQLHRELKRTPPTPLLVCHRSSLALSHLVPRLRGCTPPEQISLFISHSQVRGHQYRRPCDQQPAVVTCILIKFGPRLFAPTIACH